MDKNINAFFALVRAGLWDDAGTNLAPNLNGKVDWEKVYQLAEEQSVIGVVLAGIEHSNVKPPQELLLQWIGEVQMLEQQNKSMNSFIAELVEKMRKADIYTLLVKGQGIAQCYNRPLWRASGDIDFYLSDSNFDKAKQFLRPLVASFDPDNSLAEHINMHYDDWVVEIHANQHITLSRRINHLLDEIHQDLFYGGSVRSWRVDSTQVFLPSPDNDALLLFTHFLSHFYKGGVGIRQVCDWCRLLWTFKDSLNHSLLETRVRKAGLVSEWRVFAAFAVEYLGMPSEAMPFYSDNRKWKLKAGKVCSFILEVGNMGHNRDMSYFEKYPYLIRKVCSMGRRCVDLIRHTRIFPLDSLMFFPNILLNGLRSAARGE